MTIILCMCFFCSVTRKNFSRDLKMVVSQNGFFIGFCISYPGTFFQEFHLICFHYVLIITTIRQYILPTGNKETLYTLEFPSLYKLTFPIHLETVAPSKLGIICKPLISRFLRFFCQTRITNPNMFNGVSYYKMLGHILNTTHSNN